MSKSEFMGFSQNFISVSAKALNVFFYIDPRHKCRAILKIYYIKLLRIIELFKGKN